MQDREEAETGKTQDVLHFKPAPVKIVTSPQALKILDDPDYYIIIEILRRKPMTIREIEDAYRLRAADHETVEAKSYNTIYRYLKAFEKEDLVVAAGKRIEFGKTASETLFSRTAKLFHYGCKPELSKETLDFTNRIVEGVMLIHGGIEESENCLREVVIEINRTLTDEISRLVEGNNEEKLDKLMSGDWGNMVKSLDYIAFFGIILNRPELIVKLQGCFK